VIFGIFTATWIPVFIPLVHLVPFARDLGMPNLNQVATMDLALTDATGSGADLVPVGIRRL